MKVELQLIQIKKYNLFYLPHLLFYNKCIIFVLFGFYHPLILKHNILQKLVLSYVRVLKTIFQ